MFCTASSNYATRCYGSCISSTFPHSGSNNYSEPQVWNTSNFSEFSTNCFPSSCCPPRAKARFISSSNSCVLWAILSLSVQKLFKKMFSMTHKQQLIAFSIFSHPLLSTLFFRLIFSSMFCFLVSRKDEPSCKLLYVTPERIAGNSSFLEILKCLHWKVKMFRFPTECLKPMFTSIGFWKFMLHVIDAPT